MIRSNSRLIEASLSGPGLICCTCARTSASRDGLVDLQAQPLLLAADLERAGRPRAERADQQLVELVDAAPQVLHERGRVVRVFLYSSLFSHAT